MIRATKKITQLNLSQTNWSSSGRSSPISKNSLRCITLRQKQPTHPTVCLCSVSWKNLGCPPCSLCPVATDMASHGQEASVESSRRRCSGSSPFRAKRAQLDSRAGNAVRWPRQQGRSGGPSLGRGLCLTHIHRRSVYLNIPSVFLLLQHDCVDPAPERLECALPR